MNHAAAKSAVDDLFVGRAKRLAELRAHLDGCIDCRAHYDRTARAFRALSGRPEQMTPEELLLFAPSYPEQASARGRWPALWVGAFATALAAALVLFVNSKPAEGPDEFLPRGGTPAPQSVVVRALCSRAGAVVGDARDGVCDSGDTLAFVASARGRRFAAIALVNPNCTPESCSEGVDVIVWGEEGAIAPGENEAILSNTGVWQPDYKGVAIFGPAPIDRTTAENCARGKCPPPLEHVEIQLERPGPPGQPK